MTHEEAGLSNRSTPVIQQYIFHLSRIRLCFILFFMYLYEYPIQITTIIATIIILFPSPERKFFSDEFKTCKCIVQYGYHLVSRIHFILICIRIRGSTSGNFLYIIYELIIHVY